MMAGPSTDALDLMELLVQNPNSLSKEDLEKLCEAINRESLVNDQQVGSERLSFQVRNAMNSGGDTLQSQDMKSLESINTPGTSVLESRPLSLIRSPVVMSKMSSNSFKLAKDSVKAINFRPITVAVPQPKTGCSNLSMASGDGTHTFQHPTDHILPIFTVQKTVSLNGKTPIMFVKGATGLAGKARASNFLVPNMDMESRYLVNDEVRIATVKNVPAVSSQGSGALDMVLTHPTGLTITYPLSGSYPSIERVGNMYDIHRMQSRYSVPCSEQAVATSDWLLQNFVENISTTVPRNIMYKEYVNHCNESHRRAFNQAVFGKMVRACFPNLTTRRLGVRGQSRYHYAGLGVRPESGYANNFFVNRENSNVVRSHHGRGTHRNRFGVAANVTIEDSQDEDIKPKSKMKKVEDEYEYGNDINNEGKDEDREKILVVYPGICDLKQIVDIDQASLHSFLNFYSAYNKQLLSYITALDLTKTRDHLQNFTVFLPLDCVHLLHHSAICDVIRVYDDIMYRKATDNLLPNCLGSLTTEFKVSVRKFAKTFIPWVAEVAAICVVPDQVHNVRIVRATAWAELVRRVTTLCHVAKEARKALKDPTVTKQLLMDLDSIPIQETALMCAWCGNDETIPGDYDVTCHRDLIIQELEQVTRYVSIFSRLLQDQAGIEEYVRTLESIVTDQAGLKDLDEIKVGNDTLEEYSGKARQFVMKWALYTSKMLTEITLRTSGSVGTFHLISLLFGDYISHIIAVRKEKARVFQRAAKIVRKDLLMIE